MRKLFVTVAILGMLFMPLATSTHTAASRTDRTDALAPTPAPISAGGSIATAIGLVTSPKDLIFALRGGGTTDFWQYSIPENIWTALANTPAPVEDGGAMVQVHSFSVCADRDSGYALATLRGGNTKDFWLFDIKTNRWCVGPNTPAPVGAGGAIAQTQNSGRIYAFRGGATADFWKFEDGIWSKLVDAPGPVQAGGGLVGINHGTKSQKRYLYALQGGGSTAVWKFDLSSETWSHLTDAPGPIGSGGAITSSNAGSGDEGVLIILQGGESTKVWNLDVKTNANVWREINSAPAPVTNGGAIAAQFNGCNFGLTGGESNHFFSTGTLDCLVINPAPDFSIHFTQSTVTVAQPGKIKVQINVQREDGFTGKISLALASPKPQGIVVPEDLQLPESDSIGFKIKVKVTAQKGTFPLTFSGVDTNGRVRNATLTLIVE
jgi:hypothetical protein